jgi:hypothetical protein
MRSYQDTIRDEKEGRTADSDLTVRSNIPRLSIFKKKKQSVVLYPRTTFVSLCILSQQICTPRS